MERQLAQPQDGNRLILNNRPGFRLLTIAGIPITVDLSWFIIFLLVAWSAGDLFHLWMPEASLALIVALGGGGALLLFVSVLLHELSHSLVARLKGLEVEGITLFIFGGVSHMAREPDTPTDEVQIALAGPVLSFALAGLCLATYLASLPMGLEPLSSLLLYLSLVNVALGIFNLVPAFPLDGGRVLRAWFWNNRRSFTGATIAAARVGRILAITLMGLGLLLALATRSFSGIWWVVLGLFLHRAAAGSGEHARFRAALENVRIAQIMSPRTTTSSETMVATWPPMAAPDEPAMAVLERMLRSGRARLPVIRDGILVGMVTKQDILRAAASRF